MQYFPLSDSPEQFSRQSPEFFFNLLIIGPKVQYENTYKLDPDKRFDAKKVRSVIEDTLEQMFNNEKYSAVEMGHMCKKASVSIKDAVKQLGFERYKFVCTVSVTQPEDQGVKFASRYLWDDRKDSWVDAVYCNSNLIAQATIYALYYE